METNNKSMEGSIAKELYSGILQPASDEQDKNVILTQLDEKLQETDPGDSWYDDGSSSEGLVKESHEISDMDREWQKRHDQFHTIGYRDGLMAGQEFAAQEGFNIGFKDSVSTGYSWGLVRGVASAMACLPIELKEKLVESEDTRKKFQLLHESVQAISTTDALKVFYEDHKRKSAEHDSAKGSSTSADSKNQSGDDNIFEKYSGQLHSVVNDSPLIDVHLEINK